MMKIYALAVLLILTISLKQCEYFSVARVEQQTIFWSIFVFFTLNRWGDLVLSLHIGHTRLCGELPLARHWFLGWSVSRRQRHLRQSDRAQRRWVPQTTDTNTSMSLVIVECHNTHIDRTHSMGVCLDCVLLLFFVNIHSEMFFQVF